MDNFSLRFLISLAVIFSTTFSSVAPASIRLAIVAPIKPQGKIVRFHDCNQTTCSVSATARYTTDPNTVLTVLSATSSGIKICFQITHDGKKFVLKVISSSLIVFQKLSKQDTNCKSVNATIFVRSHLLGQTSKVRFISQKQGIPTQTRYLAVNDTTGSLFLTNELNTYNVFDKI